MRAHAPGSVTVVFAPVQDTSLGVSFAISDGIVAAVESADTTAVTLDGTPTTFEPVELALGELGVAARVDLESEMPVGQGFGASGAATLSAVLAANVEFGLGRSRDTLVEVAARAEVEAGGYVYPIIETGLKFYSPLRYDDPMWVNTQPGDLGRVRLTFNYVITHAETGDIICTGFTEHCALNSAGRPVGIDEKTKQLWASFPK